MTRQPLLDLALVFLRLGSIGFGGPAAHIAMMEDEVVHRRRWMTREAFLDLLGATNLIPGPNSTELAIHIGRLRAGWSGLLVAGLSFILPATLIVWLLAWAYLRFGHLPETDALLYGVKPVVIAVVLQALAGLGRSAIKTWWLAIIGAASIALTLLNVHELAILLAAGVACAIGQVPEPKGPKVPRFWLVVAPVTSAVVGPATASFSLTTLFGVFLKIGAVLFGSGYVLLAFLRADFVERLGWLTEAQLLDAVAVGQITPGPLFTTATFIGYLLGGVPGAVVATVGIFLPGFVFVALSGPLVPRLRRSARAGAFLDGVIAASLALMAVVTWQLARAALIDGWTVGLALASAVVLLWFRVSSAWLVLGGGLAGLVARLLI